MHQYCPPAPGSGPSNSSSSEEHFTLIPGGCGSEGSPLLDMPTIKVGSAAPPQMTPVYPSEKHQNRWDWPGVHLMVHRFIRRKYMGFTDGFTHVSVNVFFYLKLGRAFRTCSNHPCFHTKISIKLPSVPMARFRNPTRPVTTFHGIMQHKPSKKPLPQLQQLPGPVRKVLFP